MPERPSLPDEKPPVQGLAARAAQKDAGLVRELLSFLAHEKKWWLAPILLVLLLLGLFMLLSSSAVAPFIYPLF